MKKANAWLSQSSFWEYGDQPLELQRIYWLVLETARITSIVLQIYCPEKSTQVLDILGVPENERMLSDAKLKDE